MKKRTIATIFYLASIYSFMFSIYPVRSLNLYIALSMFILGTVIFILGRRVGEKENPAKKLRLSFLMSILSLFIFGCSFIGSTNADLGFGGIAFLFIWPVVWFFSIIFFIVGTKFDKKVKQELVYTGQNETSGNPARMSFRNSVIIFILGLSMLFIPSLISPGSILSLFTLFLPAVGYMLMFVATISLIITIFKK